MLGGAVGLNASFYCFKYFDPIVDTESNHPGLAPDGSSLFQIIRSDEDTSNKLCSRLLDTLPRFQMFRSNGGLGMWIEIQVSSHPEVT